MAVRSYKEGEHTLPLLDAHVAGSKVFEDEDLPAVANWVSDYVLLKGSCCCMHLCFYHPGN